MKIMKKVWLDELKIVINDDLPSKKWDQTFFHEKPSLLDWNHSCRSIWKPIVEKCANLMSIEFSTNFVLSKNDVQTIVDRCPKLYEIKLFSILVTVDAINPLCQLKNLHSLELGETNIWNLNIDFDVWTLIAYDYRNCDVSTFDSGEKSNQTSMMPSSYWHIPNSKKFSQILSNCFQNWNHLRKLQINLYKISAEVSESLIYLTENLRNLKLTGIKSVEHKNVLMKFFKSRNSLLKLSLEFVSYGDKTEKQLCEEEILKIITDRCSLIRSINVQYCGYYGQFPKAITFRKIQKFKQLSVINSHFGDSLNFLQTSPDLELLTLIGIVDDDIDKIWRKEWNLKKLKSLDIKIERKYFTIEDIVEILRTNSNLTSIQIPLIDFLAEDDIRLIAKYCQSIKKLTLSNFYNPLTYQKFFEIFIENVFNGDHRRKSKLPLLVKTTKNLTVPNRFQNLPVFIEVLP